MHTIVDKPENTLTFNTKTTVSLLIKCYFLPHNLLPNF